MRQQRLPLKGTQKFKPKLKGKPIETHKAIVSGQKVEFIRGMYMSPANQILRFDHLGIAFAIQKEGDRYYLYHQEGAIACAWKKMIVWKRADKGDRPARLSKYQAKGWTEDDGTIHVQRIVHRWEVTFTRSTMAEKLKEIVDQLRPGAYVAGGAVSRLFQDTADE